MLNNFFYFYFLKFLSFLNDLIKTFLLLYSLPFIFWYINLFLIIVFSNLISLIPKVLNLNTFVVVPLFLSFWVFLVVNFFGFQLNGFKGWVCNFYPTVVPDLLIVVFFRIL